MRRLLLLEIKRILKSRQTIILLGVGLVMAFVMGIAPLSYQRFVYENEKGDKITLKGMEAIEYKKSIRAEYYGEVTPEKILDALYSYQNTIHEVGGITENHEDFPLSVYAEKLSPIMPLLSKLPEVYADSKTGIGAELKSIKPKDILNFYDQSHLHLIDFIGLQYDDNVNIQDYAISLYDRVDAPFYLYGEFSRDAFDYIALFIFVLLMISVAIAAPAFSENYENYSDSIFRCTKYGRGGLAFLKLFSLFLILTIYYIICISIQLLILNIGFGLESLSTSVHMLFSAITIVPLNLGQLQILVAAGGLLSLLATVSFTLFVSSNIKKSLTSMLITMLVCLAPSMVYSQLADTWLLYLLPSAGIGLLNSLLYQMINLNFLEIGSLVFWTPNIILFASAIWILVYIPLAIMSYCRHQCI